MPVPTSYTEVTLKEYMIATLGAVATSLSWTTISQQVEEALIDALIAYGVDDIADVTDIKKIRALAKLSVWQAVSREVSGDFSFSADGASYNREQVHAQAQLEIARAETDAMPYLSNYRITTATARHPDDVYREVEDDEAS